MPLAIGGDRSVTMLNPQRQRAIAARVKNMFAFAIVLGAIWVVGVFVLLVRFASLPLHKRVRVRPRLSHQQLRQLRNVGRNPPRFIARDWQQRGGRDPPRNRQTPALACCCRGQ
jgi:hypothetical protein